MGLILDSSIIIATKRHGETPVQLLEAIAAAAGNQQTAIASVGLAELVHGIYRAPTIETRARRQSFIQDL